MLANMLANIPPAKIPFLVHELVASPAATVFIFRSHKQLAPLSDAGRLILQCYGGCLLFTNLISLVFLLRPEIDETTRLVAWAFCFWHAWPSYRAIVRMRDGIDTKGEMGRTLGGPTVHLSCHVLLMALFLIPGLMI